MFKFSQIILNTIWEKVSTCCAAYNRDGIRLATISKLIHGNSPLLAEILLTIEAALEMAKQLDWQKVGFFNDLRIAIESIINRNSPFL